MIRELSFNREIAIELGVNKAIILHYLSFFIEKNRNANLNFKDDRYWVDISQDDIYKFLNFFNSKYSIGSNIRKLIEEGYLLANYPKGKLTSYAFSDKLIEVYKGSYVKIEDSKMSEVEDLTEVIEVVKHINKVRERLKLRPHNEHSINKPHKSLILSRLKEGYSLSDLFMVVDMKEKEWISDIKMQKYLRIETLFNKTKFNKYISDLPLTLSSNDKKIKEILRTLSVQFGMRGIKNDKSDLLAKAVMKLGYENVSNLKQYLK